MALDWSSRPASSRNGAPAALTVAAVHNSSDDEDFRRRFDPSRSRMHRLVPERDLIIYDPVKQVSHLQTQHPRTGAIEPDTFTLVCSIHGACREDGKPGAQAAWGVFFGPESEYNACGRLDPSLAQTGIRAEIEALWRVLGIVRGIVGGDMMLKEVRIRSDSEWVVRAMSEWIEEWMYNRGKRKAGGGFVQHFEALGRINDLLDEMEYGDDAGGLDFGFWHVRREANWEADELAQKGFDVVD